MASSQIQTKVTPLEIRQQVVKCAIDVVVTAGADTTTSTTYTFDRAFTAAPQILGQAFCLAAASAKANVQVVAVTATTITVSMYQVLAGDLASATYSVQVNVVGDLVG